MKRLLWLGLLLAADASAQVSYLGNCTLDAGAGDGSGSCTIPSGATLAVIASAAWDSGGTGTPLANVSVDGQNDTTVISQDIGALDETATYLGWAKNFTTGAGKTVAWTWTNNETISEGGRIYISFWSGADLTTPFADADFARGQSLTAVQVAGLTTPVDSVVVTQIMSYSGTPEMSADGAPSITSVLDDDAYQSQISDIDYFARTQATHTIDMTNENYSVVIAVALAIAVAAGQSPLPIILQQIAANDDEYEPKLVANSR